MPGQTVFLSGGDRRLSGPPVGLRPGGLGCFCGHIPETWAVCLADSGLRINFAADMETEFHYATLSDGLRVVMRHRPGAVAEHCGIAVNAGSRDEEPGRYGLAHFVEHTIFKGTARRRAWHILNRMERVGGELNAYTTKEETMLYSTFPAGNLARALDLVADLVIDSRFPSAEIERERQVVCDEIDTYLDIPSEGIFDDFEELAYAGSSLAHPILGSRESVAGLDRAVCREYLERFYTPGEMVLFYSGGEDPGRFLKMAGKYFAPLLRPDCQRGRQVPAEVERFEVERVIGTHQAHTVLGARLPGLNDPLRYAMSLLTNILGGPGMNSLLNVALRERRGLVYTIDASTSLMTDTGLFTIYFGCDGDDVKRCCRLVGDVIDRLRDTEMTPRRLEEAKRQYTGQLALASTQTEQAALSMARSTLYLGRALTARETLDAIRSVTADEIRECASRLSLSRLTLS